MAVDKIHGSMIETGTIPASQLSFKDFPRRYQKGLTKTSNGNAVATRVLFTTYKLATTTTVDDLSVDINGVTQNTFTLHKNGSNEVIGVDFGEDLGTLKVNVSWLQSSEV